MHRDDTFEVKSHSNLCRLHFSDADITRERIDTKKSRAKKRVETLSRKRIKPHEQIAGSIVKKKESMHIESKKITSLQELVEKMTGHVPSGVHMIIHSDENILSFVSLKFVVITKVKYCLRVTSDLKFHISCNDCIISPNEIKSLTSVLGAQCPNKEISPQTPKF